MNTEPTAAGWHYIKAGASTGQPAGPITWKQLFSLAQTGALAPSDLVWHSSLPQWIQAGQIQALFPGTVYSAAQAGRPGAQPGAYPAYPGSPGAPAPKSSPTWLAWAIPLALLVLAGIGLGVYFGLFHGKDSDDSQVTVSSKTTTTTEAVASTGSITTTSDATTTSEAVTTTTEAVTTTTTVAVATGWTDLAPAGAVPPKRDTSTMVFHSGLGKAILFGGYGETGPLSDTWLYDPAANSWAEAAPTGTLPPARVGAAMFYDPVSERAVLFGGWSEDLQLDDTWAYDPLTDTWSDLMPSGTYPSARAYHAMVYDPVADKAFLFGGWDDFAGSEVNDMFVYNAAGNTWDQVSPAGAVPSARESHTMAYAPDRGLIYLFGGFDGTDYLNDLWVYSVAENAWTSVSPTGGAPAGRGSHAMVYDADAGRLIVSGGYGGDWGLGDTWLYDPDANTWTELTGDVAPYDRWGASMVYDPVRGRAILFGGYDGEAELGDTWSLTP